MVSAIAMGSIVAWAASCTGNDPVFVDPGDGGGATPSDAPPTSDGGGAPSDGGTTEAGTAALTPKVMLALANETTCALRGDGALWE